LRILASSARGLKRLRHIGIAAGGARLRLVAAQCIGSDDDDRDALEGGVGLDAAGGLIAVENRKLDDLVPGMGKKIAKNCTIVLLILDHKNASGHMWPTCCWTLTGILMKNVEPLPGADSTQI
jgi:hypothetical protein